MIGNAENVVLLFLHTNILTLLYIPSLTYAITGLSMTETLYFTIEEYARRSDSISD